MSNAVNLNGPKTLVRFALSYSMQLWDVSGSVRLKEITSHLT